MESRAQYFWAGNRPSNPANDHICQCGINGNCALADYKCNCDTMIDELELADTGIYRSRLLVIG